MNTRINKTLSVLAVLGIVASSFVWALPVAASTPGDGQFTIQDIPSTTDNVLLSGSMIADIAVGTDGKTIYVANLGGDMLYKSTDAGQSFDSIKNNYATAAGSTSVPAKLSVAPDDVNTVAVTDGTQVIISKDGGTTWSALPAPVLTTGNGTITDIAAAPARSGTLLGREYVISIATGDAGVTGGDVKILGGSATWATVGGGIADTADFTSVAVTPNFLGDRCIVAVGTGAATGSTALFIVNTSTNTLVVSPATKLVTTAGTTTEFLGAAFNTTSIQSSDIALPSNFDPTTSSGRRAYVGIASGTAAGDNDVYRVEDTTAKALGATSLPVFTVAYAGTVDSGTLFIGPKNSVDVKYSKNMTSSSPDWTTTLKGPISQEPIPGTIVRTASDFATSSMVFAGTRGAAAGFNVSNDAGVSFNQESLINSTFIIKGTSFSSDAKTLFVNTQEGNSDSTGFMSLWKSALPLTTNSWQRIFTKQFSTNAVNGTTSSSVKLSGTAIFLAETKSTNGPIYVSQDSGVSFATRNGPGSGVAMGTYALRDSNTVYYADASTSGSVYKSTNAAFTWSTAVSGGVGSINSISLPKANQVIIAGTTVAISTDDAATFTTITAGLPTGTTYTTATDSAYATNNLIYATDTTVTSFVIYRVKTDNTGNTWENMAIPSFGVAGSKISGITTRSGVLYATTNSGSSGVIRTLNPTDVIGTTQQNWKSITQGLGGAVISSGISTVAGINIYARVGNTLYSFNDALATTKPTLTTPADNFADAINPNNGNGYAVDLKWSPMGNGTGQVNAVDIEIADKSNGLVGLPTVSAVSIASSNPFYTTAQTLLPNHSYLWRIRAAGMASGQALDSPWSDARTINVQSGGQVVQTQAGVVLQGPQPGAVGVNPNLVGFSWAPVSGATEYQIIIATDSALTKTVAGTPAKVTTTSYQATGLTADTTYFWAVQATQPTVSQQSIGTFTTAPKAQPSTGGTGNQTQGGGAQTIVVNQPAPETPAYIWAVIAIGAILIIAVIILIVRTRRVP